MKSLAFLCALLGIASAAPPVTSGLKLHFDGANIDSLGNTTLLDGQTVSEWKDLSGNGFHLDGLTGTPTYIQPGPGFGGLPVVAFQPTDFNGADHQRHPAGPRRLVLARRIRCLRRQPDGEPRGEGRA